MTQDQLTWLIPMFGWLALITTLFLRDNAPALEAEKQLQGRDGR